jgi:pre-mRNA-splicing factor SYF1
MNAQKTRVAYFSDKEMTYFLMYSEYEEKYGLFNHAVEILDRMTDIVPEESKQKAYEIFAAKVANYMGITRTRPIYEKALENFKGKPYILFGIRFAKLEKKLGEIDRARQIFNYLGPMVDPEMDHFMFWKVKFNSPRLGKSLRWQSEMKTLTRR